MWEVLSLIPSTTKRKDKENTYGQPCEMAPNTHHEFGTIVLVITELLLSASQVSRLTDRN